MSLLAAAGVFASAAVIIAFFAFQQGESLANTGSTLLGIKFYVLGCALVGGFLMFGVCIREAEQLAYFTYEKGPENEWDDIEVPLVG